MLNISMDDMTKKAFLNLYNLSRPEFRDWLDLNINHWHQQFAKLFRKENRFHMLVLEIGDIEPGSETIQSLLSEDVIMSEGVHVLLPTADQIDQILRELAVGSMATRVSNGDATFTVVNCLGVFACLHIPIDYDEVINKGEPYSR